MKTKAPQLVDYVEKKMLKRLFRLGSSRLGAECLKEFDSQADPKWSSSFHQLNLESVGMWGQVFRDSHPKYFKVASDLERLERLPVQEKYYNFPNNEETPELRPSFAGSGRFIRPIPEKDFPAPEGHRKSP